MTSSAASRPSGVLAVVVARGATPRLAATLRALGAQTAAPGSVLVVDVSDGRSPAERICAPGVAVVAAPRRRTFGRAVDAALRGRAPGDERWLWLLHDDSAPDPRCLEELLRAGTRGPSVAAVGPKQVDWEAPERLLEVGVRATRLGRRLPEITPDEVDQGQYDGRSDVLAVGTAGMLVRLDAWRACGGLDPRLGPFDDGLELCRRLRRGGYRVVVAPAARIAHARASYLGLGRPGAPDPRLSFGARRAARLYVGQVTAPLALLPLLWAGLLVWSPLRALARLFARSPRLALDELAAGAWALGSVPAAVWARLRLARIARVPARTLRPLEASPWEAARAGRRRSRLAHGRGDSSTRTPRRPATPGAGVAFLVTTSVLVLASAWVWRRGLGGFAGGAWSDAPRSWRALWAQGWSGWVFGGDGAPGPVDPLVALAALITAPFAPVAQPAATLRWVAILAVPMAFATAWVLAGCALRRPALRIAAGLLWCTQPALLVSASQGRLGAVLVHAALPLVAAGWWHAGRRGGSTTAWAGVGALGALAVCAAAPWMLGPGVLAAALASVGRRGVTPGGRARVWAGLLPALAVTAPSWAQAIAGAPGAWRALLAGGGAPLAAAPAASWQVLLGVPSAEPWAWPAWMCALPGGVLLAAALAAQADGGWPARIGLAAGLAAMTGAALAQRVAVAASLDVVRAWPAPALSLADLALFAAALRAAARLSAPAPRRARAMAAVAVAAALAAAVAAAAGAPGASPRAVLRPVTGPVAPVVSEWAQAGPRQARLLVLQADGGVVRARLWRGPGRLLTDTSAAVEARRWTWAAHAGGAPAATRDLRQAIATLVSVPGGASAQTLADHAVDTVVVRGPAGAEREALSNALDRSDGLERIGTVELGSLWRVRPQGAMPRRLALESGGASRGLPSGAVGAGARLTAGEGGTLVLAESADPGWRAELDGRPLRAVADPGRGEWRQAFAVPGGGGRLSVAYRPAWLGPWRWTCWIVVGLAILWLVPLRRRAA